MTIKSTKLASSLSVRCTEPRPCISRIRGYLRAAQAKPKVLGTLLKIITRPAALGSPVSSPFLQKITVYWLSTAALSAMEGESRAQPSPLVHWQQRLAGECPSSIV